MNSRLSWVPAMQSFCLAMITGLIVCCLSANAQDQEQLQEIWRKKVPEERKRFSDFLKSRRTNSYISSNVSKLLVKGKLRTFHTRRVVKRKGSFWLLNSEGDADDPLNSLNNQSYGFNSKYAFMLKKSKKSKEWVIQNVTEVTPDLDEKVLFDMKFGIPLASNEADSAGLRGLVNTVFDLLDQRIASVLLLAGTRVDKSSDNSTVEIADSRSVEPGKIEGLPGFQLYSISIDASRQNILHVNFGYEVADAKRKKSAVANCQVDFDLEAKCHPVKSHQVLKTGAEEIILDWSETLRQKSENEYEVNSLKSFSRKKSSNAVVTPFEEIHEEAVFSLDDLPESDFTVSAFGLPEPPGIEWKKTFPWYLVFAGIGTACLGIFFFLRSRAKRLERRALKPYQ